MNNMIIIPAIYEGSRDLRDKTKLRSSCIYKIQSLIKPNRCYIGSAVNFYNRKKSHLSYLRRRIHHSPKLQNHFNKYGEADIQFMILLGCDCNKEDLLKHEQFFIDSLQPYFNTSRTAGSNMGLRWHLSKETKLKISQSNLGKKMSEEARKNMSKPRSEQGKINMRKPKSAAHIEKMRQISTGKRASISTKLKMSAIHKGNKNVLGKHWTVSEKGLQNMRAAQKGHFISEETKRKISKTLTGHIEPEEVRLKKSRSRMRFIQERRKLIEQQSKAI